MNFVKFLRRPILLNTSKLLLDFEEVIIQNDVKMIISEPQYMECSDATVLQCTSEYDTSEHATVYI